MNRVQQPRTKSTLTQSWAYDTGSQVTSDILATKDQIIIKTAEKLISLDHSGNLRWENRLGADSACSPIAARGRIYAGAGSSMHSFSPTGKRFWEFKAGGVINSTPAVLRNGNVVFGSQDGFLYQVSRTGEIVWKKEIGYPIESKITTKSVDGIERIFFGASDHHLYSYDIKGNKIWGFETDGPITGGVGIIDRSIIVGSNDSAIYSLNLEGELNWKRETEGVITSDMEISNIREGKLDILAGICSSQSNMIILSETNDLLDSFDAGYWVSTAPIFHEGRVIFGSHDHNLYILSWDGKLGKETMMFDAADIVQSRPAITDKGVVCANRSGKVFYLTY